MTYQALPVSFFENLKTQKNAKVDNDEVVPFQFSEKVLKGESKVNATVPEKKKCAQ